MKRALLVLLLTAVVLTSGLTLVAQDRRAGGRRAAGLYELHMYNVRDLVLRVRDYPPDVHMDLIPSGGFGFGFFEEEEAALLAYYEGDLLVDIIRANVAPASWEELRSVSIEYTNGILIVRHTAAVHAKVADLLDALRARVAAQIRVTVRWVRIPDAVLARVFGGGPRFVLDAEAEKRLAAAMQAGEAAVVASGSVLCSNTQRVAITDVTQVSYLADYDVEIAQEATIADPIVQITHEGVIADVRPTIAGNGEIVVMEIRADAGKIAQPINEATTDVGVIEVPELDLQKIRTSVAMPAGRTAVAGGTLSGMDGKGLLLLIRGDLVK
jgi:hypothetical protein